MAKPPEMKRRQLLKTLGISVGTLALSGILPAGWVKPVVRIGVLPAHAQTSDSDPDPQARTPFFDLTFSAGTPEDDIFDPNSVSGSGGIIETPASAYYRLWRLEFGGDTSGLPASVPVTVQVIRGTLDGNNWLSSDDGASAQQILNFPKSSMGSVGPGGTVLNIGSSVPTVLVSTPGSSGTVRFSATGVTEMLVTIQYQPASP